ncbi:hypothetical protein SUGI_0552290 [Cryptomeria japonica]|uniref:U-box domain-containing protein 4 isoform X1 n=1 Tax=Cryptomeria japonica TaxID=3369 RepID=UPI002408D305|nr:U-box domain-containing protein 4 isoform X1 [Cryptomeria japonica]GLJ28114.1 hypothetical protein SUGI_0552290 [Cryptomeria japonica]
MISMSESHPKQYPSSQAHFKSYLGSLSNSLPNMQSRVRRNEMDKLQRPAPRSMRTFRSKLFSRDEVSCSMSSGPLDSSTEQSFSMEEKRTMEKPVGGIMKNSCDNDDDEEDELEWEGSDVMGVETNSFDYSQAFSDFSAYSSDISGELLRLATATSSPACKNSTGVQKEPASQAQWMGRLVKSRHLGEEQMQGNPHTSSPTARTEAINEFLEPEKLEVVVKALVEDLDAGNSIESQRNAAAELRLLAKNKTENRVMIARAGAIKPLVFLLHSPDPQTQENTVTALLNLSLCDSNKTEITSAGAIKPLIYVLKTGTSVAKQNAACALLCLSLIDENKISIGASGAIPPLVSLLISGSSRGKKDAATTLYTLSSVHQNKDKAIRAGAIKPLVELMADPSSGMVDKAVVVLSNLASVPDGKNAIVEAGGIPVLVEILEGGSKKGKEFATATLLHICVDSYLYRTLVSREGAIPPLVELSQSGTTRAKHKASALLQYLREPRQGSLREQQSECSTS